MKVFLKRFLQNILGFDTYLLLFARYKVLTLKSDPKEGDFFKFMELLPAHGVILDIGANLGIMTWHLLRTKPESNIWAFEPIPDNRAVLQTIIKEKNEEKFRLFDVALGAEPGDAEMILPEINQVKMQGLSHILHPSIEVMGSGRKYQVKVETLDNLIPKSKKVTGIKLDVENFEYFVLKGGESLLKRDQPIIYTELWDNENRKRSMNFLTGLGYTIHYFDGKSLHPYSEKSYSGQNFFFLPS